MNLYYLHLLLGLSVSGAAARRGAPRRTGTVLCGLLFKILYEMFYEKKTGPPRRGPPWGAAASGREKFSHAPESAWHCSGREQE